MDKHGFHKIFQIRWVRDSEGSKRTSVCFWSQTYLFWHRPWTCNNLQAVYQLLLYSSSSRAASFTGALRATRGRTDATSTIVLCGLSTLWYSGTGSIWPLANEVKDAYKSSIFKLKEYRLEYFEKCWRIEWRSIEFPVISYDFQVQTAFFWTCWEHDIMRRTWTGVPPCLCQPSPLGSFWRNVSRLNMVHLRGNDAGFIRFFWGCPSKNGKQTTQADYQMIQSIESIAWFVSF